MRPAVTACTSSRRCSWSRTSSAPAPRSAPTSISTTTCSCSRTCSATRRKPKEIVDQTAYNATMFAGSSSAITLPANHPDAHAAGARHTGGPRRDFVPHFARASRPRGKQRAFRKRSVPGGRRRHGQLRARQPPLQLGDLLQLRQEQVHLLQHPAQPAEVRQRAERRGRAGRCCSAARHRATRACLPAMAAACSGRRGRSGRGSGLRAARHLR